MCLATPQKVIKINGKKALLQSGSSKHWVDLSLLKNVKIGNFLLAHEDFAIGKILQADAIKIIKMISELRR